MSAPQPARWKDHKEIYPPAAEIAAALQDLGQRQTITKNGKVEYQQKWPLAEKLARSSTAI